MARCTQWAAQDLGLGKGQRRGRREVPGQCLPDPSFHNPCELAALQREPGRPGSYRGAPQSSEVRMCVSLVVSLNGYFQEIISTFKALFLVLDF